MSRLCVTIGASTVAMMALYYLQQGGMENHTDRQRDDEDVDSKTTSPSTTAFQPDPVVSVEYHGESKEDDTKLTHISISSLQPENLIHAFALTQDALLQWVTQGDSATVTNATDLNKAFPVGEQQIQGMTNKMGIPGTSEEPRRVVFAEPPVSLASVRPAVLRPSLLKKLGDVTVDCTMNRYRSEATDGLIVSFEDMIMCHELMQQMADEEAMDGQRDSLGEVMMVNFGSYRGRFRKPEQVQPDQNNLVL